MDLTGGDPSPSGQGGQGEDGGDPPEDKDREEKKEAPKKKKKEKLIFGKKDFMKVLLKMTGVGKKEALQMVKRATLNPSVVSIFSDE